jgi:hypothetical protein
VTVIIGVDPHKSTHTVVAIDRDERPLARLQLVADRCQTQRLLARAEPLGTQRSWAVESAGGLGKLLAQKLLEAGEHSSTCPRPWRRGCCSSCTAPARSSRGSSWATSVTRPGSRRLSGSLPTTAPPPSKPPAGPVRATGSTRAATAR